MYHCSRDRCFGENASSHANETTRNINSFLAHPNEVDLVSLVCEDGENG